MCWSYNAFLDIETQELVALEETSTTIIESMPEDHT